MGKGSQWLLGVHSDGAHDSLSRICAPVLRVRVRVLCSQPRHRQLTTQSSGWSERTGPPLHCPAQLGELGHSLCLSCSHFSAPEKSWAEKALLAMSWAALGERRCQESQTVPLSRSKSTKFFFGGRGVSSSVLDGEGNGTLLQYSCLENRIDGGAW